MRNRLFFILLGAALIARVIEDLVGGIAGIYQGALFPWRHFGFVPLAPLWIAISLWALQIAAGIAFIAIEKHRRLIACLAFTAVFFSLTQMYQNQRLLLLAVLFLVALGDTAEVRKALKWQIIVVYLFSFLHKMESQFWNGDVIRSFASLLKDHATLRNSRSLKSRVTRKRRRSRLSPLNSHCRRF